MRILLRDVRTVALAAALVIAPAFIMIATALDPTRADDMAVYLQEVDAARGRYLAAGLLLCLGMVAFLPATAGLARLARRGERGGVLAAGALLLATGSAFSGLTVVSGFAPEYQATAPGAPQVPVEYVQAVIYSPWAVLGAVISALGLGLGFIVIGIGLWRSRAVPRWAAVLCMAGPLAFVLPGALKSVLPDNAPGFILWLLVVIPFGVAGSALLRPGTGPSGEAADLAVVNSA